MFKDLRMAKLSIKPNLFSTTLVEYLAKELRNNNIKYMKKISYIDIKINKIIDNKYSNLIIDCIDGGIYLRGNSVKDKKISSMRRFNLGKRESDAQYCARGAYGQISRYLNKINNINMDNTVEASSNDLRGKVKIASKVNLIDLRGKLKKVASKVEDNDLIDLRKEAIKNVSDIELIDCRSIKTSELLKESYDRDMAIAIINGTVYLGDTHGECVTKYLQEMGIEDIEFFDRIDLRDTLGFNYYSQFAAAHLDGKNIYLDGQSLENITSEQAITILKHDFNECDIYDYDSREKIANTKLIGVKEMANRLKKQALTFEEEDKLLSEMENYLRNSSEWEQDYIGIFVSDSYDKIDCIDTNAFPPVIYEDGKEDYGIMVNNVEELINKLKNLK